MDGVLCLLCVSDDVSNGRVFDGFGFADSPLRGAVRGVWIPLGGNPIWLSFCRYRGRGGVLRRPAVKPAGPGAGLVVRRLPVWRGGR